MDKILMKNMTFWGYHGVYEGEKITGQNFVIDAVLFLPLSKAGKNDDLNSTVNYAEVYETIKNIAVNERYSLIESLSERICQQVLATQPLVQKICLTVKKPDAPVDGSFDYFGVEIERDRGSYE